MFSIGIIEVKTNILRESPIDGFVRKTSAGVCLVDVINQL